MPMAINTVEEYEKVLNVSWFTSDKPVEELRYHLSQSKAQMSCC